MVKILCLVLVHLMYLKSPFAMTRKLEMACTGWKIQRHQIYLYYIDLVSLVIITALKYIKAYLYILIFNVEEFLLYFCIVNPKLNFIFTSTHSRKCSLFNIEVPCFDLVWQKRNIDFSPLYFSVTIRIINTTSNMNILGLRGCIFHFYFYTKVMIFGFINFFCKSAFFPFGSRI